MTEPLSNLNVTIDLTGQILPLNKPQNFNFHFQLKGQDIKCVLGALNNNEGWKTGAAILRVQSENMCRIHFLSI